MAARPRDLALYAIALVAVVVLGLRWMDDGGGAQAVAGTADAEPAIRLDEPVDPAGAPPSSEPDSAGENGIVVHVAGAVRRTGGYPLRAGRRVDDAVRRAGGATSRADLGALNLAAPAEDGRQILVPVRGRAAGSPAAAAAAAPSAGAVAGSATAPGVPDAPIDLNTATLEQLDTLEGVGPITAQKILDARTARGGFTSVEELAEIPGIGEKRMATLRARVRV